LSCFENYDRVSGDDSKQIRNDGFPVFVKAKPKKTGLKIKPKKNEKPVNRPSLVA
jgi:hypothetical protein